MQLNRHKSEEQMGTEFCRRMSESASTAQIAMASSSASVVRNMLLATLPDAEFALLRPHLKLVRLRRNAILHDVLSCPQRVYFIESGLISRVVSMARDGGAIEVACIGRHGFIGVSVVLGTIQAIQSTVVQMPGIAQEIRAERLRLILAERPAIKEHLLKYVQLLMTLKAQVALCNAKHEIPERVARWLLRAQELCDSDELPVTHAQIASALGVRRASVSHVLADMGAGGLVACARGSLRIRDTAGLRRRACECHRVVQDRLRMFCDLPQHAHDLPELLP